MHKKAYRISVALIIVVGLWLRWPTIYNGFFSDDMVAMAMVKGVYASPRAPLDLFDFTDGSVADHARLMRFGSLPWWTVDGLRMAMMRPLASVLILVDQHLFGKNALPYHVHSTLWWIALLLVVASLFKELLPKRIALGALLLFALEEGHTFTLGWIANRGALVAMVFCALGLRAHLRWRRGGVRNAAFVSMACFSAALLSGEWAFPLMGYVVAYEACELAANRGAWRERVVALLPSALPSLVFAVTRALLGYGTRNSGVYTDPITEPLSFLIKIGERMPVFFADMVFALPANYWTIGTPWRDQLLSVGWIPPDIWLQLPGWSFWHLTIGCVAILTLAITLRVVLPARPKSEQRELSWLLLGGGLALLPMVSSFPHGRLILPAALGFAPACAVVLDEAFTRLTAHWRAGRTRRIWLPALCGAAVLYFQVGQAGLRSYDEARGTCHYFTSIRRLMVDAELDDRTIAEKRVVVLGVIEHTAMVFAPYARWVFGHPLPRSWWTLSAAPYAQDIYRPAANVLEITPLGGQFLKSEIEQLYHAERFRMQVGDRVELDGLHVEIISLADGFPQTVRFTFDASIDDPQYVFLFSSPEGLGPARLPEVGERVRYRRPTFGNSGGQRTLRALRDPNVTCQGPRPPLEECRSGFGFSDCGGTGRPVFACTWQNDCRWFVHGCVAEEYDTSSCQPEDVCCVHGWPFDSHSFTRELLPAQRLRESLAGWGARGFDVERDFRVDARVVRGLHTRPDVRCLGPHSELGPCDLGLSQIAQPGPNSLAFAFRGPHVGEGWVLSVEMIDDRAGALRARVCRVPAPPQWTADTDQRCSLDFAPICAERGDLALNMFPINEGLGPELRAKLTADFPDGVHIEAEL